MNAAGVYDVACALPVPAAVAAVAAMTRGNAMIPSIIPQVRAALPQANAA